MKRTNLQKLLCIIFALLLLFSVTSCKKDEMPPEPSVPAAFDPTAPFVPTSAYNVVYGALYEHSDVMDEATDYLSVALREIYGVDCRVKNDTYSKQDGFRPTEFEILIGETNRPQSTAAVSSLGVNDYTYFVESRNVIVICGGSPEATLQAVKQFCADVFRYNEAPADQPLWIPGTEDTHRDTYDYSSATFNGTSLTNVTVVTKANALCTNTALSLARTLGEYTGKAVPVISFAQLTGTEEIVICIGAGGVDTLYFNGYHLTSREQDGKLSIFLEASTATYMEQALEEFFDTLEVTPDGETIALSFPDAVDQPYIADYGFWTLDSKNDEEISDGVTYSEYLFHDKANKPYRMYVLAVDPTKNTFHMGSAQDGYDYTVDSANRENVKEHMQAAVANGLDVVAGVNADFFDIHGDYHPSGLAVKNGQLISSGNGNPFVAFSADGTARIDKNWYASDLATTHTAVGGSNILLDNGLPTERIKEHIDVHPRTVVGIREDGTVLLVVIDGRQAQVSNGATLYQCALLLREMGAVSAINLDGGGSSTVITRDGDTYTTQNSPSDGSLRKVYNSLLVVRVG